MHRQVILCKHHCLLQAAWPVSPYPVHCPNWESIPCSSTKTSSNHLSSGESSSCTYLAAESCSCLAPVWLPGSRAEGPQGNIPADPRQPSLCPDTSSALFPVGPMSWSMLLLTAVAADVQITLLLATSKPPLPQTHPGKDWLLRADAPLMPQQALLQFTICCRCFDNSRISHLQFSISNTICGKV